MPPLLLVGWALALLALFLSLQLHLLIALFSALLVHQLIQLLAARFAGRFTGRGHALAVAVLAALVVAVTAPLVLAAVAWLAKAGQHLPLIEARVQSVLEQAHTQLPPFLQEYLPRDFAQIQTGMLEWLHQHVGELQLAGKTAASAVVHIIVGAVLGGLVAFEEQWQPERLRPLARTLARRAALLGQSFRQVVFAQVRISALNTAFTAIFLMLVLPAFGVHLPLVKTLVTITFVAGLLPVVGNLISNAVIVLVSLSLSLYVAIAALVFLVLIHKLEYFLNARIVGSRIHARAWELLAAMLVMEAAFGIAGLVAAPVYYAYIKRELNEVGLV
ncbi:AI-2E family transporter [Verticiella sediminum]|uniref:AI-2E family transporter n=1 Tax=Verticiella sediminum TaxID=1247510 RepID=A0A556A9B3_9BURK|nr:AI-2E family transporter [Verticiella sediminum]